MGRKCSFSIVELLTAMCLIFVLLGVFAVYANVTLRVGRETALREELNNIRISVTHYQIIYGRLPQDLSSLMNQQFTFRAADGILIAKVFLEPFRIDKKGNLLDPFSRRYVYDSATGRVATSSAAYESW